MDINNLNKYGINENIINEYINKVKNGDRIIAVTGEFSAGKSTFINALLNKNKLLPSSNLECTPVLIDLIKSQNNDIEIRHNDGRTIYVDATNENIEKYAKNVQEYDKSIVGITIPVDSEYLLPNYHLIDTPGTNTTHEGHEIITKGIIRKSDLVIYVFNKSLTEYDIIKIKDVLKYTSDILFVLTNMDEKIDGVYKNKDNDYISRFVSEAEDVLKNKLDLDGYVLPVGSYAAYDDGILIDEIRSNINFIAECNNTNKIKENAKKQLSIIFEKRLEELKEELDLIKSISELDGEKINSNISKLNNKLNTIEMKEIDIRKNLEKILKENKGKIENSIVTIYKREEEKIINTLMVNEEIDEELLEVSFKTASERINKKVKEYLDKSILELINNVYLENNMKIEDINRELDIKLKANLHSPTIEELDLTCDEDLSKIREKRISDSLEIADIMDEIATDKESIETLEKMEKEKNEEYNQINKQIIAKGSYVVKYDEIVEAGAENSGKMIGRVIGEVADIALIFISPANAALKVVDTAKDTTKFVQYVAKSAKVAKDTAKVVNKIQDSQEGKILKMLDLASIGGLGERLGGALGNSIKPSKVVYVENEANKQIWISEMNELEGYKKDIVSRKSKLIIDIENANMSIVEAGRRKREIEKELAISEERERLLLARKEREYKENSRKEIESYYEGEISRICIEEMEETLIKVNSILGFATEKILIKSGAEFNNRLEVLKASIEENTKNRDGINDKLNEKNILIEELRNYKTWIDTWIA